MTTDIKVREIPQDKTHQRITFIKDFLNLWKQFEVLECFYDEAPIPSINILIKFYGGGGKEVSITIRNYILFIDVMLTLIDSLHIHNNKSFPKYSKFKPYYEEVKYE